MLSPDFKGKEREVARRAKRKRRSDPAYRAFDNIRRAILYALRGGKKYDRTFEMVGYTKIELAAHIERQFMPGMTWENYGDWHIDHIVPVADFCAEAAVDPDIKACWALSNLRPLWACQNMQKRATRTHLI